MKKLFLYGFIFTIIVFSFFISTNVQARTSSTCVSNTDCSNGAKCTNGVCLGGTIDNRIVNPTNGIETQVLPTFDLSSSLMSFVNTISSDNYIPWRTSAPIITGQSGTIVQSLIDTLRSFGFFPSDPSLVGARLFGQTTADSIYTLRTVLGVQPGDSFDRPTQSQFASFIDSFITADRTLPNQNIVPTGFSIKYPNGFVSFFNPETNMFSVPSSATSGSVPPTGTAVRCTGGSIKCGGVDIGGLGSTYSYYGCWGGEWHVMGIAC